MDLNHLFNNLKHGYQYTKTLEDGTQENVLVAPNKYMLKAADVIQHLDTQLRQVVALNQQLQKRYDDLEAQISHSSPVSSDGNAPPAADGRSD